MDYGTGLEDTHRDSDLGASSALLCSGVRLLGLEPRTPSSFFFVFEDRQRCELLSNKFWSGELQVSARGFYDAMRTLKDLVFSRKRDGTGTYGTNRTNPSAER
jgi:hypothetical protein